MNEHILPTRPPRKRWGRRAVLLLLPLLAAGIWYGRGAFLGERNPLAAYQFSAVQRGDIEDVVTATGTLQPRDYVDVGAQVSGQLKKIHVEVGSQVKAGDLLAEIDPTVYLSKVDATRAQLRNLRAQLKDREAQVTLARIQFKRQTALMAEEATTTESLQNAEANLQSAEASLESLRAQIEQNESTLRGDEANLQYARIMSPMSGTVVSISARQGQTLNTNQSAPVILRVADLNTMTVQTQVSEADVSRLRTGMDAYFTTLGGQGQRWHGKLDKIEPTPTVTNNVVLYNALFDVPNGDGRLMTQMTAQVFFVVAQAKDVLQVPMGALALAARQRPQAAAAGQGEGAARRPDGPRAGPAGETGAAPQPDGARPAADGPDAAARSENRRARGENGAMRGEARGGQRPRQATVKVLKPDDTLEERTIGIGVSNRVQAQVLFGLEEGEKVVAGLAPAGGAAAGARPPGMPGPRL